MTRSQDEERFARVAKALGHPLRVRIVDLLRREEDCIVGELADRFEVAQSTMSEHLRVLRDANVVQGIIEGPRTCYCLDPATLAWFEEEVQHRLGMPAKAANRPARRAAHDDADRHVVSSRRRVRSPAPSRRS